MTDLLKMAHHFKCFCSGHRKMTLMILLFKIVTLCLEIRKDPKSHITFKIQISHIEAGHTSGIHSSSLDQTLQESN